MLKPAGAEPPVNGPSTPILIGSAAIAQDAAPSSSVTRIPAVPCMAPFSRLRCCRTRYPPRRRQANGCRAVNHGPGAAFIPASNGNRGTDHGHGTVYGVLGGAINGGAIAGKQQAVNRRTLFRDRDYPVLNDYRAVLGGLFRAMWGLSRSELVAELDAEHARTDHGLRLYRQCVRDEDLAERIGDVLAEELHRPCVLREPDRGVVG